jgi:purine-nucleoside/S-methyl-5'-thioadenosine phosphorylase / adenosine deaminase
MLIEAPELSSHAVLRHGFFTRQGGVSEGFYASLNGGLGSGDDTARVAENRRRMMEQFAFPPEALVSLYQVHSPDVVVVERPWDARERPRADAMVTRVPGLALGVTSADCGPVLFADPFNRVVGAAHAGWRGALAGVLEATVAAMERLGAERSQIVAVLGPTICQAAYEVGPEFAAQFRDADSASEAFFRPGDRAGHAFFDLPGYIGSRLAAAGLGEHESLGHCTYAEEDLFFSYRRATHRGEPDYGRLISAIALTP